MHFLLYHKRQIESHEAEDGTLSLTSRWQSALSRSASIAFVEAEARPPFSGVLKPLAKLKNIRLEMDYTRPETWQFFEKPDLSIRELGHDEWKETTNPIRLI